MLFLVLAFGDASGEVRSLTVGVDNGSRLRREQSGFATSPKQYRGGILYNWLGPTASIGICCTVCASQHPAFRVSRLFVFHRTQ